jgi:PAS domain S-box-containing protein
MSRPKDNPDPLPLPAATAEAEDFCRTDETRRVATDRYRVFLEEVSDGFFETDLEGRFTYFNNSLCRILGYAPDEIRHSSYLRFLDLDGDGAPQDDLVARLTDSSPDSDVIWQVRRKDGQRRMLQLSTTVITDADGKSVGFRGIARDVTEVHRTRQALEESRRQAQEQYLASRRAEKRYQAFLNFLPEPVFVFNLDHTVSYLNPAFEKTFGWRLSELEGRRIPFVPDHLRQETLDGIQRLFDEKVIHDFETQRLTKDGRLLDIVLDGAIFYDEQNQPAGQVLTLRDITRQNRFDRNTQALFRISAALHHFRGLDELLAFITREVRRLLRIEGASVILIDEERQEFYFREAAYEDSETDRKLKEVRFPLDRGVAGHVYRTGEPIIVGDTAASPHFYGHVDEKSGIQTHNMLDVPIRIQARMIGVFCAVNKKSGTFDQTDLELLSTIAGMVALPIENARINEALQQSYEEVQTLNRAKDRVIHHLSHELKTPLAVLAASLDLIQKIAGADDTGRMNRVITRARRNLDRLLAMQYEIEDILRERDYRTRELLTGLVASCQDLLAAWLPADAQDGDLIGRLRARIDDTFSPREAPPTPVRLDRFITAKIAALQPRHRHRRCQVDLVVEPVPVIWIPTAVLDKIVTGLLRNALENTPDGSRVRVSVATGPGDTVELAVRDWGVGITATNQRLLFESIFSTRDSAQYTTGKPFDFNAGGRGFDLLRMRIFSERYGFKITFNSRRCGVIPQDEDQCPGSVARCLHCRTAEDCLESGGTDMRVVFSTRKPAPPENEFIKGDQ